MSAIDRAAVRRIVRDELERHHRALLLEIRADLGELRDELYAETVALDKRITAVHEPALRALTNHVARRPAP